LDWSRTFDEQGETFAAPHSLLYFDSDGTRDGDQSFEGKYVPLDVNSPEWNGLVQYIWDFGDGTPLNSEPNPWHSYSLPGTYSVSLTVRDAYGTGDVSRAYFSVVIDYPPVIHEIFAAEEILVSDSNSFSANISDFESSLGLAFYRDTNVYDGSISDRDEMLPPDLDVRWDLDIEFDADGNGNPADDWVSPNPATESRVKWVSTPCELKSAIMLEYVTQWTLKLKSFLKLLPPLLCQTSVLMTGRVGLRMRVLISLPLSL
jgi:hypothetical protein